LINLSLESASPMKTYLHTLTLLLQAPLVAVLCAADATPIQPHILRKERLRHFPTLGWPPADFR